jgi:hypothetical protein
MADMIGPTGQGRQDMADRTWQTRHCRQNMAIDQGVYRACQTGYGRQDRAERTGQDRQGIAERTGQTGHGGHDRTDRTGRTGHSRKDMEDGQAGLFIYIFIFGRTGNTGRLGQGTDQEIRAVHLLRGGQCAGEVQMSRWTQHPLPHWRVST